MKFVIYIPRGQQLHCRSAPPTPTPYPRPSSSHIPPLAPFTSMPLNRSACLPCQEGCSNVNLPRIPNLRCLSCTFSTIDHPFVLLRAGSQQRPLRCVQASFSQNYENTRVQGNGFQGRGTVYVVVVVVGAAVSEEQEQGASGMLRQRNASPRPAWQPQRQPVRPRDNSRGAPNGFTSVVKRGGAGRGGGGGRSWGWSAES